jgi:hypothetical protein
MLTNRRRVLALLSAYFATPAFVQARSMQQAPAMSRITVKELT